MAAQLVKTIDDQAEQPPLRWPKALVAAILLLVAAWGVWTYTHLADSALQAMARGQYSRAHDFYLKEAKSGNPAAQNSLGNLYYLGLGVDLNYTLARDWYFQAAKTGYANAQLNLGHLYKQGLGVDQDPVRAFGWYNMAEKYGNPVAEYYLKQMASEWALSPLMIGTVRTKWAKLEALVKEPL